MMRSLETMKTDAEAAIKNYKGGPYPMSAEDVLDLLPIAAAAIAYVDIKSNHPQISGEAWRDLVDAIEALKGGVDESDSGQ